MLAAGEEDNVGTPVLWDVKVVGLCAALFDSQVHWDDNVSLTDSRSHTSTAACPTDFDVTGGGGFINDESNSTGYVTLTSFNPGEINGIGYLTAGSTEPPPGTTANSTLYSYVVCADLR